MHSELWSWSVPEAMRNGLSQKKTQEQLEQFTNTIDCKTNNQLFHIGNIHLTDVSDA